ncbi:MAG: DUF664 domain-containing protein [Sphingobacteriales bacterium]|nr:MAG: DUF664 domain-containing protein [Sphingobacteriales bacterium]
MKDLFIQMAKYHIWANGLIIQALQRLTDEQLDTHIASSFPSIRKTVYHMWSAEQVWLDRLLLAEYPVWAESGFTRTFAEACQNWQKASAGLLDFVNKQFDDRGFEHVTEYRSRKGDLHKTPVKFILQHTFNHGTYHRGQLITMLRQLGVEKIPNTDLIAMLWAKG